MPISIRTRAIFLRSQLKDLRELLEEEYRMKCQKRRGGGCSDRIQCEIQIDQEAPVSLIGFERSKQGTDVRIISAHASL